MNRREFLAVLPAALAAAPAIKGLHVVVRPTLGGSIQRGFPTLWER